MEKKIYKQPKTQVVLMDSKCMIGTESGHGEDASLDLKFEEEPVTTEE